MPSTTYPKNPRSLQSSLVRIVALGLPILMLLGAVSARGKQDAPPPSQAEYEAKIRPATKQFCEPCHSTAKGSGGVNLSTFVQLTAVQKDQAAWRKVLTQLKDRTMPPKGAPALPPQKRDELILWLDRALNSADDSLLPKNPGRVLIHRLSRTEYNNTIRDLLGVDTRPADKFPADGGGGGGFDNDAATLFIPPVLMEQYLAAAGEAISQAKRERIFVRLGQYPSPTVAARNILSRFATLGFRRPVQRAELDRLMRLYTSARERKEGFEGAVKFALKGILVSPSFLFRVEQDQNTTAAYPVSDYELASRLSYFLWASMPDEELFALAGAKRLHNLAVLDKQVRRMLLDPRAKSFAESFAGQWLRVRDLYTSAQPDARRYPTFTPSLRDAMANETIEFFYGILKEDASLLNLLDADYSFLNEELAKHYGVEGVTGPALRKVSFGDHRRGGLLTMASVLTVTSFPQRTSPVLRGKWVLQELLGAPTPPPPPNAGGLPADDAPKSGLTFRQRLEKHREKPECASCHARMDPIGFGLENFDAIGRWRTEIGGQPVDATGVLSTGEKFTGPVELKRQMMDRKDEFLTNLTEKMLAYALGRGLEPYDLPTVKRVAAAVKSDGYKSATLIREIVKSYPFQYRKND